MVRDSIIIINKEKESKAFSLIADERKYLFLLLA